MAIPSTSNQKGIFLFFSFNVYLLWEKQLLHSARWGVSRARAHVCAHMTDEVFGNWRAGLIITNIFPACFESPFQLGVVCDASRCQSERGKMKRREGWEEWWRETGMPNEDKHTRRRKREEGVSWHLPGISSPRMLFCLILHEVGGKMTSLIRQRQTSKPHNPKHPCLTLLHFCVFVCVLYSEWCVLFTGPWSHTEKRWDEPAASARFLLTERYWGVSHFQAGWL